MNFCLTGYNWFSLVTVSDNKTIGLISFLFPSEEYISSYFLRRVNSDVGLQPYTSEYN